MSVLVVVSVMDRAVGAFGRPLFVPSVGVALRSFQDEINRQAADNQMAQHPEDFDLYELCMFDEETGRFEESTCRILARGKEVVIMRDKGNA